MRTFYVPDMSCKHCVKRITEALEKANFSNFETDLEGKKVTANVSDEEAERFILTIEEAGYTCSEGTI